MTDGVCHCEPPLLLRALSKATQSCPVIDRTILTTHDRPVFTTHAHPMFTSHDRSIFTTQASPSPAPPAHPLLMIIPPLFIRVSLLPRPKKRPAGSPRNIKSPPKTCGTFRLFVLLRDLPRSPASPWALWLNLLPPSKKISIHTPPLIKSGFFGCNGYILLVHHRISIPLPPPPFYPGGFGLDPKWWTPS
jgi:hypothetical protein